jgi:hypothetical protein
VTGERYEDGRSRDETRFVGQERRAQVEPCHRFFGEDLADDCVWECIGMGGWKGECRVERR